MKATPIIPARREVTDQGNLMCVVAWLVPVSEKYPEGVRYSFTLLCKGERVLGYDYNPVEGHHKHALRHGVLTRGPIAYQSIENVYRQFLKGVGEFEKVNNDENQED